MLRARRDPWFLGLAALILLVANSLAPFRSSSLGRVFLLGRSQHATSHSVIRVRTITSGVASLGHRAVVGLARGGRDKVETAARSVAFSGFLPLPTDTSSCQQTDQPGPRLNSPLRC